VNHQDTRQLTRALRRLLQPGLRFLKLARPCRTKEHRHRQSVSLQRWNHRVRHVPRVVSDVAEHGHAPARVVRCVEVGRDRPLAEAGKAVHLARLAFGFAQRWQKQTGQDGDDRDDNQ
jgi:hypothetical protein